MYELLSSEQFWDYIAGIVIAIALAGPFARHLIRRYRHKKSVSVRYASALLSHYTHGARIMPLSEGVIGDMHYTTFHASTEDSALIYRVELPFGSKLHLLGVPRQSNVRQINPTGVGSVFEEVRLEGSFVNYFRLYCQKGQQVDARYTFDPKVMEFVVNFCQSHSWEVVGSELYFVQTGSSHPNDTTSMFKDVEGFVANIRPAVERPLTRLELRNITPYGRDRRQNLKCPVCSVIMINEQTHYRCAEHHGVLLTGRYLTKLRDGTLTIDTQDTEAAASRAGIKCPSCQGGMVQVSYGGSKAIIDSCLKCPYRWLDGADMQYIG